MIGAAQGRKTRRGIRVYTPASETLCARLSVPALSSILKAALSKSGSIFNPRDGQWLDERSRLGLNLYIAVWDDIGQPQRRDESQYRRFPPGQQSFG